MTRVSGIAATFVVALALAPISAEAQQISACINTSSGVVTIVAPNATCRNNETLVMWGAAGSPAPALGASAFSCTPARLTNGGPLFGDATTGYIPGVSFGSGITYAPMATTFVLQPGIYLLQLSVFLHINTSNGFTQFLVNVAVNAQNVNNFFGASSVVNSSAFFPVTGDRLLQISTANTTVGFNVEFDPVQNADTFTTGTPNSCQIIFTRLQ
jgi:hypothetical protein